MLGVRKTGADTRKWTFSLVILAITLVFAFAVHTTVHFANLINIQGFPFGFYLAAQGAPIALVVIAFWVAARSASLPFHDVGDLPASGAGPSLSRSLMVGLAGTSELMSAGLIVGLFGALYTNGYDALSYGLGLLGGLILLSLFVAPKFTEKRVGSLTSFLANRYMSRIVPECALVIAGVAAVLLLGAQMQVMTLLAALLFQVRPIDMVWIAAVVTFIAMVVFRRGILFVFLMLVTVAVLIVVTLPAALTTLTYFGTPLAQVSYGMALSEIGVLELQVIEQGLADPAEMHQHARPYTNLDPLNFFAIVLTVMCGTTVYPSLLARVNSVSNAETGRHAIAWLALCAGLFAITLPAFAATTKLDLYKWIVETQPITVLPVWLQNLGRSDLAQLCGQSVSAVSLSSTSCADITETLRLQDIDIRDEILVLASPSIANATPAFLAVLGGTLVFATLVASSSVVRMIVHEITTLSEPSQLRSPQKRDLMTFTKVIVVSVFVVCAAYLAIDDRLSVMTLVTFAFGLIASALFPAVVIGSVWKGATLSGALSSIFVGAFVFSYYAIATTVFAPSFAETWSMISSAPDWKLEELAGLETACAAPASARCLELQAIARDAANWWGVSSSSAGLFAIPASVLALFLGSILSRLVSHGGAFARRA